jgi:hypothetical protein
MNLGMLLERAMADPLALANRILEQALDQLAREGALAADPSRRPEELIATAVGSRVVATESPPVVPDGPPPLHGQGDRLVRYEDLLDRNSALAAALGACDCWGEQLGCRYCGGAGQPGWVPPDRQLFVSYVYPAMRAAKRRSPPVVIDRPRENHRKENGHGYMAR